MYQVKCVKCGCEMYYEPPTHVVRRHGERVREDRICNACAMKAIGQERDEHDALLGKRSN